MKLKIIAFDYIVPEVCNNNLISLLNELKQKRVETYLHSLRVNYYCNRLCFLLNLSESTREMVLFASLFHDIGKLRIPLEIVNSPKVLLKDEKEIMQRHPLYGRDILTNIRMPYKELSINGVLHHHERLDGSGYPFGLIGHKIGLCARILAVVDSYDAIVSKRVYKEGSSSDVAIAELQEQANHKYDPIIIRALIHAHRSNLLHEESIQDTLKWLMHTQSYLLGSANNNFAILSSNSSLFR